MEVVIYCVVAFIVFEWIMDRWSYKPERIAVRVACIIALIVTEVLCRSYQ